MVDEIRESEQDKLLAELLLRISTVEKLLIDKNVITLPEYNEIFSKSVNKLMELLKTEPVKPKVSVPDGVVKH